MRKLRPYSFALLLCLGLFACNNLDPGDDPNTRKTFLENSLVNSSWRLSFVTEDAYCNYYLFEPKEAVTERYTQNDTCLTANYRWRISVDGIDMDDPDKLGILYLGAAKFYISDVRKDEFDMWREINRNGYSQLQDLTMIRISKLR